MKDQVSYLELGYIVRELQFLVGGKIDKIYHPDKSELLFQFHVPSKGKSILRVLIPKVIYLTSFKPHTDSPSGFCMALRKHLNGARVREIVQKGSERIVEILFERPERLRVIIELFAKGNLVLCRDDYSIVNLLNRDGVKTGQKYEFPKYQDFSGLSKDEFIILLGSEELVRALANNLSLGGIFAEEICLLAGVDKKKDVRDLSKKELDAIFSSYVDMISSVQSANVVFKDDLPLHVLPFHLRSFDSSVKKDFASFNEAIDEVFTQKIESASVKEAVRLKSAALGKIERTINIQRKQLGSLKASARNDQRAGEMIYENYQEIDSLLKAIRADKKKLSWPEMKEKYVSGKVRGIDEKTGKVVLEIEDEGLKDE
ncbi:NFACT family protein [Candidatus Woesearchaeota archaeon]|nr:NFACT family protein [Candidatus Woesearchaeota archaeon]